MSIEQGYERWDWSPTVRGVTKRAVNITCSDSDVTLSRVQITIEERGSDAVKLALDSSGTGITLTSGTAGAWAFTIDAISATITGTLRPVFHTIIMTLTDSQGNVLEPIKGTWQIKDR